MAFCKKKILTAEEIIAGLEELKTEETINAVTIPPEVDELTDEEEIEDCHMLINNVGDELPVDVVGTFETHATIVDKAVHKILLKKQNRKRRNL
ncbi:hypothetical protein GWI33_016566 [Rhynchophorus ferrugineus]|uniref:Uncharacterized protein n=1 Tax=Rhynchophorus ferrugineus TaxID=354439 RepID=A0A834M365_RHYFE|nr:hypothetical protein GWI33_016566 [Rhynchophorus ferrugineus]